jgi:hypothetical protein
MFLAPASISVSGISGSGKTHFTFKLIKNRNEMFTPPPGKIMYCYGVWQSAFSEIENIVEFKEGLPTKEDIEEFADGNHNLMILDDLMSEISESKIAEKIFTMYSHHKNITVLYLNQNIFFKGKTARTISLNLHYMVLFRNPRDVNQIKVLAHQTGLKKALTEAYSEICLKPYGYLVLDLSPKCIENHQITTEIFPDEYKIIYVST